MALSLFPIVYDNAFYKSILSWPIKQMAFERNNPIGALCANVEHQDGVPKMYIAILGVMVFWRRFVNLIYLILNLFRQGIGAMLLEFVEDYCRKDPSVSSICLHVQVILVNKSNLMF